MARRVKRATVRARANVARARARRLSPQQKAAKTRREHKLKRSLAARKGWRTRLRNLGKHPKPATVRKPRTRPKPHAERRDYLVSFSFASGKREYRRDLVVPAPVGTSPAQLIAQARRELPRGAATLAPYLNKRNATIYEGPTSTRKKTEMR
jgi:hypothetical protein